MKKIKLNTNSNLLFKYIAREFLINFTLSFVFFFFIFFINQILLLLQRDEVKNLSIRVIIELILLSTPQFLIFTFPFSTLTAVAMLTGDLSSKNEILAMRSLGLSLKDIYMPFFFMSILAAIGTFYIADVVNPWASDQYKVVYARVIKNMPTIALKPNSVSNIGSISVSVGNVKGENIENIRIFDVSNSDQSRLVTAQKGKIQQKEKNSYVYQLVLYNPQIMFTSNNEDKKYTLATSNDMIYSIDMTSLLPSFGEPNSLQVRTKELLNVIKKEKIIESKSKNVKNKDIYETANSITNSLTDAYATTNPANIFSHSSRIHDQIEKYNRIVRKNPMTFKRVYNETELYKRLSLSLACIILGLLAFPLSFVKVKHGKLIGFAVAMIVSVIYWSMLFLAQYWSLVSYNRPISIASKLFLPDIIFLIVAVIIFMVVTDEIRWSRKKS